MSAWNVVGAVWISDGNAEWLVEHESASLQVQRTDANEVRLGVQLKASDSDDVSFYLTLAEASRLAHMLGAVVLADEAAAHEAAHLRAAGLGDQ